MKAKLSISPSADNFVRRKLFDEPIPYGSKPSRKTELFVLVSDDSGNSFVQSRCIEDEMSKQIDMNFQEVTLSNLVSKGVEPRSLDITDTSKLGVDEGVESLARELLTNPNYVNLPNSESSK